MKMMDGRQLANKIEEDLKQQVQRFSSKPGLAFILVGTNEASRSYIKMKKKACERIGVASIDKEFPETISEIQLLEEIDWLNRDPAVDGILVQLPLPPQINTLKIVEAIKPEKDVDGFHPVNVGKMLLGDESGFLPCTPHGILELLKAYHVDLSGKHAVILGRSNIVGKPLAAMLMQKKDGCNATVSILNSRTASLKEICLSADVLIAAIGIPFFVKKEMVKPGSVIIDVGINRIINKEGKPCIVGDVDFETVAPLCSYITPVPGGVGPMTIVMLLKNTISSYLKKNHLNR
ncbi:MAG: bifunctional methylenetetrahydrofolate dehydrogenase/methenyltetrahydrofolate cyclohydrolase FolD [Rhabdochlamydiaceae bacterium]